MCTASTSTSRCSATRLAVDETVRLLPPPVLRGGRRSRARSRRIARDYPDNVLFASDYPHADGTFPGAAKALLDTDLLDDSTRRGCCETTLFASTGLE